MTKKQLIESAVTKITKKILKNKRLNEQVDVETLGFELFKNCNYDVSDMFDVFLEALQNSNHGTLVKYLGRFAADLERHGWKVEDTKLYTAGY